MASSIRFGKTCTLERPTVSSKGQAVGGAPTTVKCALWKRRLRAVIGGEVTQVDAVAFVPSGTTVALRDQMVQAGERFVVMSVVPADDDRGRTDHIGLQLKLMVGA